MRLQPGDKLGPYETLAPTGAGGMGKEYRARDTRLMLGERFCFTARRLCVRNPIIEIASAPGHHTPNRLL
jgi:hypothetical protein